MEGSLGPGTIVGSWIVPSSSECDADSAARVLSLAPGQNVTTGWCRATNKQCTYAAYCSFDRSGQHLRASVSEFGPACDTQVATSKPASDGCTVAETGSGQSAKCCFAPPPNDPLPVAWSWDKSSGGGTCSTDQQHGIVAVALGKTFLCADCHLCFDGIGQYEFESTFVQST